VNRAGPAGCDIGKRPPDQLAPLSPAATRRVVRQRRSAR
jgi:hypothetical protein